MRAYCPLIALLVFMLAPLTLASAAENSELSAASQALSEASIAVPAGSVELLKAGGTFSVIALKRVSAGVELVLEASAAGGRLSLVVASELVEAAGLTVGVSVTAVAVSGGFMLWAGSQALAFVADASLLPHVHRRELRRDDRARWEASR